MALALADRYSSLSVQSCLRPKESGQAIAVHGDPMVDVPLLSNNQRSFPVPPGIEVAMSYT